jgi:ubiquinone/menaquinone biosynthesis C-methylase UbiE
MLGFLRYGATASNLSGIDILLDRVVLAKQTLPESKISCADGQFLPYESAQFDILLQFTAFSSILDPQIKRNMASEMLRVLKPDGVILWYDFWWNPTNPQTAGIKPKEIKILFSNCVFKLHKITLAPPIARLIVPISWALAVILESLKVFNSHYLAIITKQ